MGMFDSLYDAEGHEWQTKAYSRVLDQIEIGEAMSELADAPDLADYQVEVLGSDADDNFVESFATVRGGVLTEVPAERDPALPLAGYSSGIEYPEESSDD